MNDSVAVDAVEPAELASQEVAKEPKKGLVGSTSNYLPSILMTIFRDWTILRCVVRSVSWMSE